jgi:uncharacterized protein (TIGR02265 family)
MRARFTTAVDVPLDGDFDVAVAAADLPSDHMLKGLFFARLVSALGDGWVDVQGGLEAPPEQGRYHTFESYPMTDYLRLLHAVAHERFGVHSGREGVRLLARGEIDVFAESTLGKVTFAMLREPGAALLRYPDAIGILGQGPRITARRVADDHVVVSYPIYFGSVEYAIGVIEGIVLAFDAAPRLEVAWDRDRRLTVDVRW